MNQNFCLTCAYHIMSFIDSKWHEILWSGFIGVALTKKNQKTKPALTVRHVKTMKETYLRFDLKLTLTSDLYSRPRQGQTLFNKVGDKGHILPYMYQKFHSESYFQINKNSNFEGQQVFLFKLISNNSIHVFPFKNQ